MYSSAYVWAKVLSYMEERIGAVTVSAWFDDAEVVELTEEQLILFSPSDFRREIILRRCTEYHRRYSERYTPKRLRPSPPLFLWRSTPLSYRQSRRWSDSGNKERLLR